MKITLKIEGQDRTFVQDFIPARMFRKTIEMQSKLSKGVDEKALDSMVSYVADIFGNQFTIDQFYDGMDARKMLSVITGTINEIVSGSAEAVGADTESPNE